MDLGTVVLSWESSRPPISSRAKEVVPVKRSCSTALVCSLLGCFASPWLFCLHQYRGFPAPESSVSLGCAFTHLSRRSGITRSVEPHCIPRSLQPPPKPSSPQDSRLCSSPRQRQCLLHHGRSCKNTLTDRRLSQRNQGCREFL